MEPKPTVYIDLVGTLMKWKDNENHPNVNEHSLQKICQLQYGDSEAIPCGLASPINSHKETSPVHNYRNISPLHKYREILLELRETCQLKLISTENKQVTTQINDKFNLGFDKRDILSKEDILTQDFQDYYPHVSHNICPECLLISNHDLISKSATIQRLALGIDKEQQIMLQLLSIKALEESHIQPESYRDNEKIKINNLAYDLDTNSKKQFGRNYRHQHSPEIF